jgi:hypothetical protein
LLGQLFQNIIAKVVEFDKEGEIVKDKNGKYYQLTNERVFGNERYRLIEIDTVSFKRF